MFPRPAAAPMAAKISPLLLPHCSPIPAQARTLRGAARANRGGQRARLADNHHVAMQADEETFVKLRTERDARLAAPKLILPALQVNIRAGELPPTDANGIRYLRLPLNHFGGQA